MDKDISKDIKDITLTQEILSAQEDKICIPKQPCNVLFISFTLMKF